jgi:nicotinamide phosphoribosyltransferase
MNDNFILLVDSYKNGHDVQYEPGTTRVKSYFSARSRAKWDTVIPFGLQAMVERYMKRAITMADIDEAESYFIPHMGTFNRAKWEYIVKQLGGHLPLVIHAVPEGLPVPKEMLLASVENTDTRCAWLTNYSETLLVQNWYPTTVATQSYHMRKLLMKALEESGNPELIDYKMHDFGCRGSTCMEQAAIGGTAHLTSFNGSDTVPALPYARKYYDEYMAAHSINASEHSTITSWGKEREVWAYRNMIEQYGNQTFACVSDSYDIYNACKNPWGGELKESVLNMEGNLVIRPDSGNPLEVLPRVLAILWECFGGEVNVRGYKVLNPKVRVIQGDGINYESFQEIMRAVMAAGWSMDNLAFGSGGGLLQALTRDTLDMAFKACETVVDGEIRYVSKDPVTDPGKRSLGGNLALYKAQSGWTTTDIKYAGSSYERIDREIFRDGEVLVHDSLATIRGRCR